MIIFNYINIIIYLITYTRGKAHVAGAISPKSLAVINYGKVQYKRSLFIIEFL